MATKSFIAQQGMSAIDIASYCYGDASQLFQLRKDNPGFDFNKGDYAGIKINYRPSNNSNSVTRLFTNSIPASGSYVPSKYLQQEDGFDFLLENNTGKIKLE